MPRNLAKTVTVWMDQRKFINNLFKSDINIYYFICSINYFLIQQNNKLNVLKYLRRNEDLQKILTVFIVFKKDNSLKKFIFSWYFW